MAFWTFFDVLEGRIQEKMNILFVILWCLSLVSAVWQHNGAPLGEALLNGGREAISLAVTLAGAMMLWSGIMEIGRRAGLCRWLGRLLRPITRWLFPDVQDEEALEAIHMNISSNLLGLGNAATPYGLTAMQRMAKTAPGGQASHSMITFAVLNSASLQLIPTTVASLRSAAGAAQPFDILLCVWISSFASVVVGLLACRLCGRWSR